MHSKTASHSKTLLSYSVTRFLKTSPLSLESTPLSPTRLGLKSIRVLRFRGGVPICFEVLLLSHSIYFQVVLFSSLSIGLDSIRVLQFGGLGGRGGDSGREGMAFGVKVSDSGIRFATASPLPIPYAPRPE